MLKFVDFHYTNSVFFYKRIDGYGERVSASATTIFYSLGLCSVLVNIIQQFTGTLAPLARQLIPALDRPYDNAAEFVFAVPFAFALQYFWFWRRTSLLTNRYAMLAAGNRRSTLVIGSLLSIIFLLTCIWGRDNFPASAGAAFLILFGQELGFFWWRRLKA